MSQGDLQRGAEKDGAVCQMYRAVSDADALAVMYCRCCLLYATTKNTHLAALPCSAAAEITLVRCCCFAAIAVECTVAGYAKGVYAFTFFPAAYRSGKQAGRISCLLRCFPSVHQCRRTVPYVQPASPFQVPTALARSSLHTPATPSSRQTPPPPPPPICHYIARRHELMCM